MVYGERWRASNTASFITSSERARETSTDLETITGRSGSLSGHSLHLKTPRPFFYPSAPAKPTRFTLRFKANTRFMEFLSKVTPELHRNMKFALDVRWVLTVKSLLSSSLFSHVWKSTIAAWWPEPRIRSRVSQKITRGREKPETTTTNTTSYF